MIRETIRKIKPETSWLKSRDWAWMRTTSREGGRTTKCPAGAGGDNLRLEAPGGQRTAPERGGRTAFCPGRGGRTMFGAARGGRTTGNNPRGFCPAALPAWASVHLSSDQLSELFPSALGDSEISVRARGSRLGWGWLVLWSRSNISTVN